MNVKRLVIPFFISYIFFFHLQKTRIWKTISKIEKSCSTLTQWKKISFLLMDAQWKKTPHPNLQHHVFRKVRICFFPNWCRFFLMTNEWLFYCRNYLRLKNIFCKYLYIFLRIPFFKDNFFCIFISFIKPNFPGNWIYITDSSCFWQ